MKKIISLSLFAFALGVFFLIPVQAEAAGPCYCELKTGSSAECINAGVVRECVSDTQRNCELQQDAAACDRKVAEFNNRTRGNTTAAPTSTPRSSGGLVSLLIPDCALEDKLNLTGECGDVTVFLILMFKIINYLFSIIGGVALLFFIYGGFVFILSEGNSEKVAHGKSIILSAVLGIIIAFSGYALVQFVGTIAGIKGEYQLIGDPKQ